MTELELYERIGRQQVAFEQFDCEYTNLLNLLAKLKSGDVALDSVTVDTTTRTWAIAPGVANARHDG